MQINIIGRHWEVPDNLKSYILEKAEKLPKYYDRVMEVEVIVDGEPPERRIELIVSVAGHPSFVAEDRGEDLFACFDICFDKVERQLRRFKEKVRNRKHHPGGRREVGE